MLGYEGMKVINPEGGKDDAEEEAQRGRWKQKERDSYWKMMDKYIGSDVTSMVTLPVLIFEPMTMIRKMAELMEYSYLLEQADECKTTAEREAMEFERGNEEVNIITVCPALAIGPMLQSTISSTSSIFLNYYKGLVWLEISHSSDYSLFR